MATRLEVFADIACPFTHIGLKKVVSELDHLNDAVEVIVRSWPLEWVNGAPLEAEAVKMKITALHDQLGTNDFNGFRGDTWPTTTIPALNLEAAGFGIDASTGLGVSLALRDALFEEGRDVSDLAVLTSIADQFGLDPPRAEAGACVRADYEDGQRRGVRGSPDFWVGDEEFFCPALTLGHNNGGLTAKFDTKGFRRFMERLRASSTD
ncbi:MAG: disulfide bond formation protein DsbA [Actinomycetia bacterium]|nr:disulfide bond formation protein DsbA [Actinomycetes bacterium]